MDDAALFELIFLYFLIFLYSDATAKSPDLSLSTCKSPKSVFFWHLPTFREWKWSCDHTSRTRATGSLYSVLLFCRPVALLLLRITWKINHRKNNLQDIKYHFFSEKPWYFGYKRVFFWHFGVSMHLLQIQTCLCGACWSAKADVFSIISPEFCPQHDRYSNRENGPLQGNKKRIVRQEVPASNALFDFGSRRKTYFFLPIASRIFALQRSK